MKKSTASSPDRILAAQKDNLLSAIKDSGALLKDKMITAGFDGFTDSIVKIIKKKQAGRGPAFFSTIKQFGEYITEKQAASFSLELLEQSIKPGGNMPIMANTLGTLGVGVNCIGALGYPQISPVFSGLSSNCRLYSFAEPGMATAFEFNDGKMFLAQMGALNITGWKEIKNILGLEKIASLFAQSDMACLLNWSEIDASTDIWQGLLNEVFSTYPKDKKQTVFVDLSDCSKRSKETIHEALELLAGFSKYCQVILSLNRNEAGIIAKVLFGKKQGSDLHKQGANIFESLALHTLLIHSAKETLAFRGNEQVELPTFYTPNPLISTGAGDNFNAGFCVAHLMQLSLEPAVLLANAVAGIYIRTGKAAQQNDIISFFEKK